MAEIRALTLARDALRAQQSMSSVHTEAPREILDLFTELSRQLGAESVADALRLVLVFYPGHAALYRTGADTDFNRERWSEAADLACRAAVAAGHDTPEGHMVAAAYLFRARRFAEARHHAALAERLAPGAAGPLFLHGRVLVALDLVDEGFSRIDRAATSDANFQFAARVLRLGLTAADFDRVKSDPAFAKADGGNNLTRHGKNGPG